MTIGVSIKLTIIEKMISNNVYISSPSLIWFLIILNFKVYVENICFIKL